MSEGRRDGVKIKNIKYIYMYIYKREIYRKRIRLTTAATAMCVSNEIKQRPPPGSKW